MEELIDAGSPINQSMAKGATPLYLAADMGHVDVVRRLVQVKRPPSSLILKLPPSSMPSALPAFHLDRLNPYLDSQSGAYLNACTVEGSTALTAATWRGDLQVIYSCRDARSFDVWTLTTHSSIASCSIDATLFALPAACLLWWRPPRINERLPPCYLSVDRSAP